MGEQKYPKLIAFLDNLPSSDLPFLPILYLSTSNNIIQSLPKFINLLPYRFGIQVLYWCMYPKKI